MSKEFLKFYVQPVNSLPKDISNNRTLIILREGIRIDDVEAAGSDQLFALYEVLPFSLKNLDTRPFIPALFPHVRQNIWMRFNDHMLRWPHWQFLEEGIDLPLRLAV